MAKIKNESAIKKELEKQAKKLEWDTLAYEIFLLEITGYVEKDPNYIRLLEIKLEVWEKEKEKRVSDAFDMEYFLSKDLEYIESDPFDDSGF